MNNLRFERTEYENAPDLYSFSDHTVYQTIEWLSFISATQDAERVIAVIKENDKIVGRFTGLIVKKYGLRILGSPFRGWTTGYIGFNLKPSISRADALEALTNFAFNDLNCVHLEMLDRRLSIETVENMGYKYTRFPGFEIDLTKSEDDLFDAMSSACRRCIRKSTKEGIIVEEAKDSDFAYEYYAQLEDVYAKQKLVPSHSAERVRVMIEHMIPTDHLLLLKAKNKDGICIATAVFPAMNDTMYFWGGASWRSYQILRPNELLQWYAMKYWKAKGISKYDMGGAGEYKRKYGGYEIAVPWVRKSKYAIFEYLRSGAGNLYALKQHLIGITKR